MGRMGFSCLLALASATLGHVQAGYLLQNGAPTFTAAEPAELGFVNADSRIWQIVNNGSSKSWQPTNVPNSWGGWRFVTTADGTPITYSAIRYNCGGVNFYWVYSALVWTAPDGTQRFFPGKTQQDSGCGVGNVRTATAYAEDSSGYYISVTNYTQAIVYAKDGTGFRFNAGCLQCEGP